MPAWDYDLIIIGGGPAGLTAGIYAGRARLKTLLLEKLIHGGQMMTTDLVENYPGFPEGITGFELSDRMRKQAERFGLLIRSQEVLELKPGKPVHTVVLEDGQLTAGADHHRHGGPLSAAGGPGGRQAHRPRGEFLRHLRRRLLSKTRPSPWWAGVTTPSPKSFSWTRFAKKIHLIHRRDQFRACKYLQERVLEMDKVQVHWDTVVTECKGQSELEALELRNVKTGEHYHPAGHRGLHRHRHGAQHRLAR